MKAHIALVSRVTTAHLPGNIAPCGFFSLMMNLEDETALDGPSRQRARTKNRLFAAVHLEWLAVSRSMQGNGIGKFLLAHAITQFSRVAEIAGVPFMTVAAIDQRTCDFYAKLGFVPFGTTNIVSPRMLLPAQLAIQLARAGHQD